MIALSFAILLALAEVVCRMHDRQSTRWAVGVVWEGSKYAHYATSRSDALSWAACYPHTAIVYIIKYVHGRGEIVSSRGRHNLKGI